MNELKNILLPGTDGFDEATRPWNLAVHQPVAAVVLAESADDVAAAVSYARLNGLTITAQASGHGASGDSEGLLLLRTDGLTELEIRPGERVARVGAGVKWGDVLAAAGPHGLTGLAGSSPVVSVTGYTLGGGLSWFSRKYGLAANSVRSFDIVDAEGVQRTVDAESDPDLFWALRGAGGDFAVVTAIEFDLHPAPHLYGGRIMWPADRAPEVLAAYREVTATAPDELTVWFDLLQFPGSPAFVAVDSTYLGEDPGDLLAPFDKISGAISDSRGPLQVADLGTIAAEPTDPSPGLARAELLTALDDDVAELLLAEPIAPLLSVQIRHLGGALAREADSAAGNLAEPYSIYLFGIPLPGVPEKLRSLGDTLVPHTTGRRPYTFLAPGDNAASAFSGETLARLRELKRARDPRGVLRANYPVGQGL
ncbi:FAD-binding oxidoreductase [Nonomuraea sp. NPDC050556]|uniref:FAD-binding oxidoreductase n=1 Tax=Nonomuraea sp. NPDC050556 TaxID=3364369 RepID=UPI0037B15C71